MAQRNFRDRRAQKCNDLEVENLQLKQSHESDRSAWMEQLRQRDAENATLAAQLADGNAKLAQTDLENRQLKERIAEMQRELGTSYMTLLSKIPSTCAAFSKEKFSSLRVKLTQVMSSTNQNHTNTSI